MKRRRLGVGLILYVLPLLSNCEFGKDRSGYYTNPLEPGAPAHRPPPPPPPPPPRPRQTARGYQPPPPPLTFQGPRSYNKVPTDPYVGLTYETKNSGNHLGSQFGGNQAKFVPSTFVSPPTSESFASFQDAAPPPGRRPQIQHPQAPRRFEWQYHQDKPNRASQPQRIIQMPPRVGIDPLRPPIHHPSFANHQLPPQPIESRPPAHRPQWATNPPTLRVFTPPPPAWATNPPARNTAPSWRAHQLPVIHQSIDQAVVKHTVKSEQNVKKIQQVEQQKHFTQAPVTRGSVGTSQMNTQPPVWRQGAKNTNDEISWAQNTKPPASVTPAQPRRMATIIVPRIGRLEPQLNRPKTVLLPINAPPPPHQHQTQPRLSNTLQSFNVDETFAGSNSVHPPGVLPRHQQQVEPATVDKAMLDSNKVVVHIFLNAKNKMKQHAESHSGAPVHGLFGIGTSHGGPGAHMDSVIITKDFDNDRAAFVPKERADAMVRNGPSNIVEVKAMVSTPDSKMERTMNKAVNKELEKAIPIVMNRMQGPVSTMDDDLRKELEQALVDEIAKNLGETIDDINEVTEEDLNKLIEEGFNEIEKEVNKTTTTRTKPTTATTKPAITIISASSTTAKPIVTTASTAKITTRTTRVQPTTTTRSTTSARPITTSTTRRVTQTTTERRTTARKDIEATTTARRQPITQQPTRAAATTERATTTTTRRPATTRQPVTAARTQSTVTVKLSTRTTWFFTPGFRVTTTEAKKTVAPIEFSHDKDTTVVTKAETTTKARNTPTTTTATTTATQYSNPKASVTRWPDTTPGTYTQGNIVNTPEEKKEQVPTQFNNDKWPSVSDNNDYEDLDAQPITPAAGLITTTKSNSFAGANMMELGEKMPPASENSVEHIHDHTIVPTTPPPAGGTSEEPEPIVTSKPIHIVHINEDENTTKEPLVTIPLPVEVDASTQSTTKSRRLKTTTPIFNEYEFYDDTTIPVKLDFVTAPYTITPLYNYTWHQIRTEYAPDDFDTNPPNTQAHFTTDAPIMFPYIPMMKIFHPQSHIDDITVDKSPATSPILQTQTSPTQPPFPTAAPTEPPLPSAAPTPRIMIPGEENTPSTESSVAPTNEHLVTKSHPDSFGDLNMMRKPMVDHIAPIEDETTFPSVAPSSQASQATITTESTTVQPIAPFSPEATIAPTTNAPITQAPVAPTETTVPPFITTQHIFEVGTTSTVATSDAQPTVTPKASQEDFASPHPTHTSHEVLPMPDAVIIPQGVCPTPNDPSDHTRSDVLFLLDSSDAINEDKFRRAVLLILDTVDHFRNIGPDGVQVSLVQYNTEPYLEFSLRKHNCKKWLMDDIANTEFMNGGNMLGKALDKVSRFAFTKKRGDRPDAENFIVVVTDGQSEDRIQEPVELARQNNVTVLVIATLEASPEYLMGLAGHSDNIFHLTDPATPLAKKIATRINTIATALNSNQPIAGTASPSTPVEPSVSHDDDRTVEVVDKKDQQHRQDVQVHTPLVVPAVHSVHEGIVHLDCTASGFKINLNLPGSFEGVAVVKGHESDPNCKKEIHTEATTGNRTLDFFISNDSCGVTKIKSLDPGGQNSSVLLQLIHNSALVTDGDRAFLLQCFVGSETEVSTRLDIIKSEVMIAETISLSSIPPTCSYSIRADSPNGPVIQKAVVGQIVFHRWDCDGGEQANYVYGIQVHNCYAGDDVAQEFAIVDNRGCSSDLAVLADPVYMDDHLSAYAQSRAFGFQQSDSMNFTCKLSLCTRDGDGCEGVTPPSCGDSSRNSSSDLFLTRRLRHQNSAMEGALTSALSTKVGVSSAGPSNLNERLSDLVTSKSMWLLALLTVMAVIGTVILARYARNINDATTTCSDPETGPHEFPSGFRPSVDQSDTPSISTASNSLDPPTPPPAVNPRLAEFMKDFDRSRYI